MPRPGLRTLPPLLFCALLVTLAGCNEEVVRPRIEDSPFTLYSILNPKADVQAIVVWPIEHRLRPLGPEALDAVVRSTDVETGDVRIWADSVVFDGESGYAHVFWSNFRPGYGRTYVIEASRSDGAVSSALANVPPEIAIEEDERHDAVVHVRLPGEGFRPISTVVGFTVRQREQEPITFPIDHSLRARQDAGGWTLEIRPFQYRTWLESWYLSEHARRFGVDLLRGPLEITSLWLDVTIVEEAWKPTRPAQHDPFARPEYIEDLSRYVSPLFDPHALPHPGVLDNVRNGFGFVGGGYRQRFILCPSVDLLRNSGYVVISPRPCQLR